MLAILTAQISDWLADQLRNNFCVVQHGSFIIVFGDAKAAVDRYYIETDISESIFTVVVRGGYFLSGGRSFDLSDPSCLSLLKDYVILIANKIKSDESR